MQQAFQDEQEITSSHLTDNLFINHVLYIINTLLIK